MGAEPPVITVDEEEKLCKAVKHIVSMHVLQKLLVMPTEAVL